MRLAIVLLCLFGLSGCTFELRPVQYDGEVNYRTGKDGSLQLVSYSDVESLDRLFDVERENGGVKYSNTGFNSTDFGFDVLDERIFAESLASELTRRGLVSIDKVSDQIDRNKYLSVQLVFTKKVFEHRFGPDFKLEAALQLRSPNREMRKIYKASSYEDDSFWDRMNSNGQDGKILAAKNLIDKIIPDIETFLQLESTGLKSPS